MRGTDAVNQKRAVGYQMGEVDQAAVDSFVAQAQQMPAQKRQQAADRLLADLKRGYNPFGNDKASFATLGAIVDAIDSLQ